MLSDKPAWRGRMGTALYTNQFAEACIGLLARSGASCYRMGQYTGPDQAYLSRPKRGEVHSPSPEVIIRIGQALTRFSDKVRINDIEALSDCGKWSLRIRT